MIVKKMPILQGFPDFDTVKLPDYHDIPLFYISLAR